MKLSIVIPVFNEERHVIESLQEVLRFLNCGAYDYELLVVDDGSTDNTPRLVSDLAADNRRIRHILLSPNQGKGEAVKQGMRTADGDYCLFMDIDLSVPLDAIDAFAAIARDKQPEVIIGTRKTKGATIVKKQPFYREYLGKGFTWLTNTVLGTAYSDITCGFKCFSSEAAKKIFSRQQIKGWSFDSEILFLAKRFNYRVVEVPVVWRDDPDTRVRLLKDIFRSFWELVKIRLMYL